MASDSSSVRAYMRTTRFAFVRRLHAPIDALLAAGGDFDRLARASSGVEQSRAVSPSQFELRPCTLLVVLQIVVDVGREDDFVVLDEEPRRLQADDQVLAGDDFGVALRRPSCRGPCPRR